MVCPGLAFTMKTLGTSVIVALIGLPRFVLAQPALSPIYVTVHLAPECQGVSDFAGRLLSRTHRLRWAYPGEPGIVFDVAAQPIPMGYAGQLQIRELDGRTTHRSVEGTTCDGVINALAFVAAVLVDPAQSVEPAPAPLPPPPPPPAAMPPEPPAPRAFSLGLGLTSGFTTATAPAYIQPNLGVRLNMAWDGRGLSPWITVGLDQRFDSTATSTLTAAGRSESIKTTLGGWNAHMALSPMRWPATGYYSLRPVALFEIGKSRPAPILPQMLQPNLNKTASGWPRDWARLQRLRSTHHLPQLPTLESWLPSNGGTTTTMRPAKFTHSKCASWT